MSKRAAETVARNVEELVQLSRANVTPTADLAKWATGLDGRIHRTLASWGLLDARMEVTADQKQCGVFFETYVVSRTDLKPTTRTKYRQAAKWFTDRVGADRHLSTITPAEFDQWHRWMVDEGLSQSTANKHAKRVKKFFAEAIRARLLIANPAAGSRIGGEVNRDRDHFITRDVATKILEKCDTEWALIFGLCRYAGFRCPTEVLDLLWADVHWDENRLRIDSVKTDLRFCPIFPELRPLLDAAWTIAPTGARHVVSRYRGRESNLRTQMHRIIESAGLKPWPKTFVNLRASCRTDLEDRFPGHVLDTWLGHSAAIANRHYLQTTDAHWERAVSETVDATTNVSGPAGGPVSAPQADSTSVSAKNKPRENRGSDKRGPIVKSKKMPPLGLEPRTHGLRVRCSTN
tara:strand:+ start:21858 stop:23072 length:1215 start_codon:yes stop_codon:yes gene_type:complete